MKGSDKAKPKRGAAPRPRDGEAGGRGGKPRIKATHAEGAPEARRTQRSKPGAGAVSPEKVEERRARARASLRALGARPAGRRLPPGPTKGRDAVPVSARPGIGRRKSVAPPSPSSVSRELAIVIAAAGLEKKAIGVEVLDVSGRVDYADYLVIMTGTSDRHVQSIAGGIEEALKKRKTNPLSVEGMGAASWVLMDYDDVVVHVFQEETRRLYDIEGLWMDAGRVTLEGSPPV